MAKKAKPIKVKPPKFPLSPLARFPRLTSIKQHFASIEHVMAPFALNMEKSDPQFYQFFSGVKELIAECEHDLRDLTDEEFAKAEAGLCTADNIFSADGSVLSGHRYKKMEEYVRELGVDQAAADFKRINAVNTMFGVATEEELFQARVGYLPPVFLTWIYTAARFLPPIDDAEPEEKRFALYRYIDKSVTPQALLAVSKIPCISDIADCLEERCANMFLLMCAVFLEEIPEKERKKNEYWIVRFKNGSRKKFRALLREDFGELFDCWDHGEFSEAETLAYSVRYHEDDDPCLDIRERYHVTEVKLLDDVWMTVALAFSVWTTKRFGELGRVRPSEDMGDLDFSFVRFHRWLLAAIDNVRILLSGLDPRRHLSGVSWLLREDESAIKIFRNASPEECARFLAEDGEIASFLYRLAERTKGQDKSDAEFVLSLLRACLYGDAAPPALFQLITYHSDMVEDEEEAAFPLLAWEGARRKYAELFHVNTDISYGNGWHPVPPFDVLNAVCYAIASLIHERISLREFLKKDEWPVQMNLPGGVADFAALVSSFLEQYAFTVLREERKVHRRLPAIAAAKRMLGEEELAALREELSVTKASLADAREAAALSAGEAMRALQERADAADTAARKLSKEVSGLTAEVSQLQAALAEKTAAFDALFSSLQEPSEETMELSAAEIATRLCKLSFAFVGGHIKRLRELRDLGIVPKVTISATHQPKLTTVDAVVIFTDWLAHTDYYAGENIRKYCGAERVFVSGATSTERTLQIIWAGLSPELKKKCEE